MSLITCPDCGKSISDQAPVCLGCGRPVSVSVAAPLAPPAEPTEDQVKAANRRALVVSAIVGMCLSAAVLAAVTILQDRSVRGTLDLGAVLHLAAVVFGTALGVAIGSVLWGWIIGRLVAAIVPTGARVGNGWKAVAFLSAMALPWVVRLAVAALRS